MQRVQVLGVGIDDVSLSQAVSTVKSWINTSKGNKKYMIVTPNPEFLVLADQEREFKQTLNQANMAIPDGFGLKLFGGVRNVTPGTDLMEELCRVGGDLGWSVGLIGGKDGIAKKTAECLKAKYPNLKVTFAESGPKLNNLSDYTLNTSYIIPNTDILFVAFGMGKQERWIEANLNQLPVKVAMGVGGAFDYLSGLVPRAPKLMRSFGLEWLFRLIIQPWRLKRQLRLIKFIYLILKERL